MPAAIARDPEETVFEYRGIISPPRDWSEWYEVVRALTAHLVERYGVDEVATWGFEVWNEPNLEVFWTGTQHDYLRLYDESARAVKSVHPSLRVGGPSTAAAEWVEALAAHADATGAPLDFVTSHTYGNLPLDTNGSIDRHGFTGIPTWWTEWGVGSTHYGPIHDGVIGAPFALSGFHEVQGRMEALSYWVISDHFEELGRPPRLFHNGFGLLTVGNLRKPRYWAVHLAAHQGDDVLATELAGDGAQVLVRTWATKHDDGTVDVLVWNGTINGALMDGDPRLDREVEITVDGLLDAALPRRARPHRRAPLEHPRRVPDRGRLARRPAVATPARGRPAARAAASRGRHHRHQCSIPHLAPHARRRPGPARPVDDDGYGKGRFTMTRVSRVRTALVCTSIAALTTLGVSACQGHANDTSSAAGTLTIQGDAGDPTLTENFNPFSSTQLEGTRLIYEPLEIASSVDGTFTPFLATGHTFTNPKTLVFTLRSGVKWSDGQAVHGQGRAVHLQPAEEVLGAGHDRRLVAAGRHQRVGRQGHRDVQAAERAVRPGRRRRPDRARTPLVARCPVTRQVHQHQAGRHRAVHARHVRADPVHREEERLLLAGRQGRARARSSSPRSRATRAPTSSTSPAGSSTGRTTTCPT